MEELKESNAEQLLIICLEFLRSEEEQVLLILDNVEDLLYYDKPAFRVLINELLINCPSLHILMTSRTTLGALQDASEKILVLGELSAYFTVELFRSRAREIDEGEIKELMGCSQENHILIGNTAN